MKKLIIGLALASIVTSSALAATRVRQSTANESQGYVYSAGAGYAGHEAPNEAARDAACAEGCN